MTRCCHYADFIWAEEKQIPVNHMNVNYKIMTMYCTDILMNNGYVYTSVICQILKYFEIF